MAQWPFAHTIEMTYRLQAGVLEVHTRMENLSAEPMPVVIGFHPYPQANALKDYDLDHVFGDLVRDASGRALMSVQGKSQKLEVLFGPNYRSAVIYAPKPNAEAAPGRGVTGAQNRNFICFEPMAGITDAVNLAHRGIYKELQSIPSGGIWQESFWVRPSGF